MIMNKGAITVGTADWLEATQGMRISAYVETFTFTTAESREGFSRLDFEEALRKTSRRVESSPPDKASSET